MATKFTGLYPKDRAWEREGRGSPRPGVLIGGPGARAKQIEYTILFTLHFGTFFGAIWYLATHSTNWVIWSQFIVGYLIVNFGFSVGFHRYFTHKAFECSLAMRYILGITGQMSATGSLRKWAPDHRRHHAFSDRVGDLHSPIVDGHGREMGIVKGLLIAHFGWLWDNAHTDLEMFGKGLLGDPVVEFCHKTRWLWIAFSYLIFPSAWAMLFGNAADILGCVLVGAGLRNFIFLNGVMGTDSFAHVLGYRHFDDESTSTNNWLVAILTLGDGWHNNHHGQPRAASNHINWWEIDPNGMTIFAMEKLGLAWNVQRRAKGRAPIVGQVETVPMQNIPEPHELSGKPAMFANEQSGKEMERVN